MSLPPPSSFGAPERYDVWRRGQDRAFAALMTDQKKFAVLALPTGVGKSLVVMTYTQLLDVRSLVLTGTKGLQDQYSKDYSELGLVDARGMRNYVCKLVGEPTMCDEGPCLEGEDCELRRGGCLYYDALDRARARKLVVTNYAMALTQGPGGLGKRELLIADEAHEIPEQLTSFLRVEVNAMGAPVELRLPRNPAQVTLEQWRDWAGDEAARLTAGLPDVPRGSLARRVRVQIADLERLATSTGHWVMETTSRGWAFEPLWPEEYAGIWLWDQAQRVVLASATIRPYILKRLGLFPSEYTWIECDSPFPVSRRPIVHIPTVALNKDTSRENMLLQVARLDQIIEGRLDRKGIVHTVSYDRAQFIVNTSRYRSVMIAHGTDDARLRIQQFRNAAAPMILVSPTVHTGWDFPYDLARYQVIMKIPFPDTRSAITRARTEADKQYSVQCAVTKLVQMAGRINRAEDDLGETFVLDDHLERWIIKRHRDYFPRSFLSAYRSSSSIPPAIAL